MKQNTLLWILLFISIALNIKCFFLDGEEVTTADDIEISAVSIPVADAQGLFQELKLCSAGSQNQDSCSGVIKGGSINIETLMAVIASDTSADCVSFMFAKSSDPSSPFYNNGELFLLLHADRVVVNAAGTGLNPDQIQIVSGSGAYYSSEMLCPMICPNY